MSDLRRQTGGGSNLPPLSDRSSSGAGHRAGRGGAPEARPRGTWTRTQIGSANRRESRVRTPSLGRFPGRASRGRSGRWRLSAGAPAMAGDPARRPRDPKRLNRKRVHEAAEPARDGKCRAIARVRRSVHVWNAVCEARCEAFRRPSPALVHVDVSLAGASGPIRVRRFPGSESVSPSRPGLMYPLTRAGPNKSWPRRALGASAIFRDAAAARVSPAPASGAS